MKNSLKIFDADLLVVISGCTSGIIGDNLEEVSSLYSDSNTPVLVADAAGFKGNNIFGHEQVLRAIIEQYLKPAEKINKKQVNVWGIIPYFDPFWAGTYDEIEKILLQIGLEPNIIYGGGRGIKNIQKIPEAGFNLVLSPWWDLNIAKLLKEKFRTPYFHYPVFPVGPTETTKFLHALSDYTSLDKKAVNQFIEKSEAEYYYYIERAVTWMYDARRLPKHFITIANSTYALGLSKYLINDLGMIPDTQYITDGVPEDIQDSITDEFKNFDGGLKADVKFEMDGGAIAEELRDKIYDDRNKPFILGSSWDDILALEINAYLLTITAPVSDRVILDRNYFGFKGGQRFFEDFFGKVSESIIHKSPHMKNQIL